MGENFERIVIFNPAYDKRDPVPSKNYGICAVRIYFALVGKKGAISASVMTDWYLPETIDEYKRIGNQNQTPPTDLRGEDRKMLDYHGVFLHTKKPQYKCQEQNKCDLLKQGFCYGGEIRDLEDKVGDILLRRGTEGLWEEFEKIYKTL